MRKMLCALLGGICIIAALSGCDPLTVHKVSTTIFDGVPSLPAADQYCQEYYQNRVNEEKGDAAKKLSSTALAGAGSIHPPYQEKRCDKCHDKSQDSGLLKPREQLCFICHPDILNHGGFYQHGPAATGSCLECHDPHSSVNKSLLKFEKAKLCAACHKETRLAASMHDKVTASGLLCTDCHDPHAGAAPYFLR
jgi:predicted CXXCH cytochrome family protein